jgi:hypothetical protein
MELLMNTNRTGTPEARASRTPHLANPTLDLDPPQRALAADYLRISADGQPQHLSLQAQQASLRRHISQLGWKLVRTYLDEEPGTTRHHRRHSNP